MLGSFHGFEEGIRDGMCMGFKKGYFYGSLEGVLDRTFHGIVGCIDRWLVELNKE